MSNSDDPTTYIARREYGKAVEIYRSRLSRAPEHAPSRLALADTLLMDGKLSDAVREYKELGAQYSSEGFLVKAIAMYKKVLKLSPDDTEAEGLLSRLVDQRKSGGVRLPMPPTQGGVAESPPPALEDLAPFVEESAAIELGADAILMSEPAPSLELESKLFTDLLREELHDFISLLSLRHFEEDTIVVQEGAPGDSMFIVVRGQVRVLTRDSRQKEIVLANLGEGEFFGEVSLLTRRPRTATIITNLSTELLELTRQDFDDLVGRFPRVRNVMEEFLKQRAYRTIEAMVQSLRENS